jgi:hypothetical protein
VSSCPSVGRRAGRWLFSARRYADAGGTTFPASLLVLTGELNESAGHLRHSRAYFLFRLSVAGKVIC